MKINSKILLSSLAGSLFLVACGDSKFPGFDKTDTGLYYNITEADDRGKQVNMDDIITIDLKYSSDDSVLYNSENVPYPTQLKVSPPAYQGDVMEGFTLMSEGDEAIFKTPADSFFSAIARVDLPAFIQSGSYLTFEVKINKAQTIEELQAEKEAEAMVNKEKEAGLLQQFLSENNITEEPKASGLIFIETAPGNGQSPARGDMVKVHYIGRLLTGEKFDASYDRGEPIEFQLGSGQVIPGWDEGIGYMTVGSKAQIIIPSELAYGQNPPPGGLIKPFSPLVFDVELVEVNASEE